MKRTLFLSVLLAFVSALWAQQLKVLEFKADPSDNAAAAFPKTDFNGKPCALVLVGLTVANAQFEGDVISAERHDDGVYWVYLMAGSRWLEITTPDYLPLRYDFEPVMGNITYYMQIERPARALEGPVGEVDIVSNVRQAEVWVDGEKLSSVTPFTYRGPEGDHVVELRAPGYNTERFTVRVELNQRLRQTMDMHAEGSFSLNGISYEMVRVEGGSFFMGSVKSGNKNSTFCYEAPSHNVSLKAFSLGRTEVTQALWQEVMGSNPSMNQGLNLPVENVSWYDCQEFIKRLNERCGTRFRLPTEAEWEFAACERQNGRGQFFSGDKVPDKVAVRGRQTKEVGRRQPNSLGLYDMAGNVAEWCADWSDLYGASSQLNPTGPEKGVSKVVRGGSYDQHRWYLRNACRQSLRPDSALPTIGLRLAQDL